MTNPTNDSIQHFMGNVLGQLTGSCTVACGILGHELGLYKAMAGKGALAADDVAQAAATHPRLTREWLDQQASVGFIAYDADADRYELSAEGALALADERSPVFVAGSMVAFRAMIIGTEKLAAAFRGDGGLGWGEQHPDLFRGTREFFRPAYENFLAQQWIPALEGVATKLEAGAKVADVGCGHGMSTIHLAKAFPKSTFAGFDYHAASIEEASRLASGASLANASFAASAADEFTGRFDLICFCDCLHDMGDPVSIARHAKSQLAEGGTVMLVEPFAHDTRHENHDGHLGGLMYAASTFFCTPCSLSQEGGRAMGAQSGERGMRAVFEEAGFSVFRRATETPFNIVYEAKA